MQEGAMAKQEERDQSPAVCFASAALQNSATRRLLLLQTTAMDCASGGGFQRCRMKRLGEEKQQHFFFSFCGKEHFGWRLLR